jgi:hypothetical protein
LHELPSSATNRAVKTQSPYYFLRGIREGDS